MKALVAPDKFKGSLTAAQVADHLAEGMEQVDGVRCTRLPLADGGDGSVAAAVAAGFQPITVEVNGPTGRPHQATIAFDGSTAVVEVANTCGITLLPGGALEPLTSSSLGFGQAVRAALRLGPSVVVLALGGSASTDAGLGLLTALGGTVTDATGRPVEPSGAGLAHAAKVDLTAIRTGVRLVVAGDVDAVLHGPHGAAHLFAPQKGADPDAVGRLDRGLARLSDLCGSAGRAVAATPGAGAAGGLGFAALLLGAELRSGADFFLDLLGFDRHVADADVVVTGEGRIDDQTLHGKLPYVVALRSAPRPTYAVAGLNEISRDSPLERAFTGVYQLAGRTTVDTRNDPHLTASLLAEIGRDISAEQRAAGRPVESAEVGDARGRPAS